MASCPQKKVQRPMWRLQQIMSLPDRLLKNIASWRRDLDIRPITCYANTLQLGYDIQI